MKKVLIILLIMITLGGCMLKEENQSGKSKDSSLPSADWSGAKAAVETNLTDIFEKALEEKYGETFIIKSVSTPSLMQGYYSAKFAPEWKPDVKLNAKFDGLNKEGKPFGLEDGYIAVKFSEQSDALIIPIFDQYFSEYSISRSYGESYYPSYLDGNSTFDDFYNYISDFGPNILLKVEQEDITMDYINEHFDEIVNQVQSVYPKAGSFYISLKINGENLGVTKDIIWGRG